MPLETPIKETGHLQVRGQGFGKVLWTLPKDPLIAMEHESSTAPHIQHLSFRKGLGVPLDPPYGPSHC